MSERLYNYRRHLPHYQKPGVPLFVTFRKASPEYFSGTARSIVLHHCLYGHEKTYELHAAVVMPDHVHLLLTPFPDSTGWPISLKGILRGIKGASARNVNKLSNSSGPVWQNESFDHVLRSTESLREKMEYIRQNPVRKHLVSEPDQYPWLWIQSGW